MYIYLIPLWFLFRLHDLATFAHFTFLAGKGLVSAGGYVVDKITHKSESPADDEDERCFTVILPEIKPE